MLRSTLLAPRMGLVAVRALSSASGEKYFDKILIANRGEISIRVQQTARRMGIKTVAVYSEADAEAPHVRFADEAVCVGPPPSAESYLVEDAIVEAARSTGAEAIHPGYGFLSENAGFATRLEKEGITFIGPRASAIEAMGDKIESKRLAHEAGVSTIPGFVGEVHSDEEVLKISREIGYPVMIKASAGGGGKGMRIAWNDEEAIEGFRLSKEEAIASFGDDRMLIEKFVEDPRHIEIQLLGDNHGNVIALPERECSVQRRNQKVVEEAPCLLLDPATRRAMQEEAVALAKAVDYNTAGTVEMLSDPRKNFYFLEMNTRLQVEHPITELVSGLDLVEQMIRVASGHKLPADLVENWPEPVGWAFESRVYAEDPMRGFLPSIGRLMKYEEPSGPGVRMDSGIEEGGEISMYYDPLVSKLITYADTREQAIDVMKDALDEYVIRGFSHNVPFLGALYRHPRFVEGRLSTAFIDEEYPDGFHGIELTEEDKTKLVASAALMQKARLERASMAHAGEMVDSYRLEPVVHLVATVGEDKFDVTFDGPAMSIAPKADDGHSLSVDFAGLDWFPGQPKAVVELDDDEFTVQPLESHDAGYLLQYAGTPFEVTLRTPRGEELASHMLPKVERDTSRLLLSPMPGSLVSVAVKPGDKVVAGQELAVVEAMKMQNVLRAAKSGIIKEINCEPGSTLAVDEQILELE
eukprot:PLAT9184.1.p2 GENE.PLAT9184.1~~PLAT9184.1.p2  ORF type:complete len:696 (-),score=347.80 PLAT9184.1:427-2514(-)